MLTKIINLTEITFQGTSAYKLPQWYKIINNYIIIIPIAVFGVLVSGGTQSVTESKNYGS